MMLMAVSLSHSHRVLIGRHSLTEKADVIRDYFEGRQEDLARAKSLLSDPKYYREAILVLSCHIGALGACCLNP